MYTVLFETEQKYAIDIYMYSFDRQWDEHYCTDKLSVSYKMNTAKVTCIHRVCNYSMIYVI